MKLDFMSAGPGAPEGILAEAELWFDDGPLAGMKLVGINIRASDRTKGEVYATMPCRAFGTGRDRRYFDFLRPQEQYESGGADVVRDFKAWVVGEYLKWCAAARPLSETRAKEVLPF